MSHSLVLGASGRRCCKEKAADARLAAGSDVGLAPRSSIPGAVLPDNTSSLLELAAASRPMLSKRSLHCTVEPRMCGTLPRSKSSALCIPHTHGFQCSSYPTYRRWHSALPILSLSLALFLSNSAEPDASLKSTERGQTSSTGSVNQSVKEEPYSVKPSNEEIRHLREEEDQKPMGEYTPPPTCRGMLGDGNMWRAHGVTRQRQLRSKYSSGSWSILQVTGAHSRADQYWATRS